MKFKKNHMIFFSCCPLKILKFDVAICKCNISKSKIAKDLKPGLADNRMMSRIFGEN